MKVAILVFPGVQELDFEDITEQQKVQYQAETQKLQNGFTWILRS
jgi:hypothetical protein